MIIYRLDFYGLVFVLAIEIKIKIILYVIIRHLTFGFSFSVRS